VLNDGDAGNMLMYQRAQLTAAKADSALVLSNCSSLGAVCSTSTKGDVAAGLEEMLLSLLWLAWVGWLPRTETADC